MWCAITAPDRRPLSFCTSVRNTITAEAWPVMIADAATPKAAAMPPPPPPQTWLDQRSSRMPRSGIRRTGSLLSSP